jgi:hypothetical protein
MAWPPSGERGQGSSTPFAKLLLLFDVRLLDDFLLRAKACERCDAERRDVRLPLSASAPLPSRRALRPAGLPGSSQSASSDATQLYVCTLHPSEYPFDQALQSTDAILEGAFAAAASTSSLCSAGPCVNGICRVALGRPDRCNRFRPAIDATCVLLPRACTVGVRTTRLPLAGLVVSVRHPTGWKARENP